MQPAAHMLHVHCIYTARALQFNLRVINKMALLLDWVQSFSFLLIACNTSNNHMGWCRRIEVFTQEVYGRYHYQPRSIAKQGDNTLGSAHTFASLSVRVVAHTSFNAIYDCLWTYRQTNRQTLPNLLSPCSLLWGGGFWGSCSTRLGSKFFEHTCAYARWAHMHRFLIMHFYIKPFKPS